MIIKSSRGPRNNALEKLRCTKKPLSTATICNSRRQILAAPIDYPGIVPLLFWSFSLAGRSFTEAKSCNYKPVRAFRLFCTHVAEPRENALRDGATKRVIKGIRPWVVLAAICWVSLSSCGISRMNAHCDCRGDSNPRLQSALPVFALAKAAAP